MVVGMFGGIVYHNFSVRGFSINFHLSINVVSADR